MNVSLVVTLLNDAESVDRLFVSIEEQTLQPDEIIVIDGGSQDDTVARLHQWVAKLPIRIVVRPGADIFERKNLAIDLASGEVVAMTDPGVVLHPDWLQRLVEPLTQTTYPVDVVGGFLAPAPQSLLEEAVAAASMPDVEEIDPDSFVPSSSSVAFRRSMFEDSGYYPDRVDHSAESALVMHMSANGARVLFRPQALARRRPPQSFNATFHDEYLKARGEGQGNLFADRHLTRYLFYMGALSLSLWSPRRWVRGLIAVTALGYLVEPATRVFRRNEDVSLGHRVTVSLGAGIVRLGGDLARMIGYSVGVWQRVVQGNQQES